MKLLADQNVHRRVVARLRDAGFAVEHVLETVPGAPDQVILLRPGIDQLTFVTGDKGFGDWTFNKGLPRPRAILLIRLPHPDWAEAAQRLLARLERDIAPGQIITFTKSGERARPFPLGASHA